MPLKKFYYPYNNPYDPKVKQQETTTTSSPSIAVKSSEIQNHAIPNKMDKYEQLISSKLHDIEETNNQITPEPYDPYKYKKIQPSKILGIYNSFQQTTPSPKFSYFNPYKNQASHFYQMPSYSQQQEVNVNKPNLAGIQQIESLVCLFLLNFLFEFF